ncbi:unnamed protein product [Bubo scandiacus]
MNHYTPLNYRAPKELIFRTLAELVLPDELSQQGPSCGIVPLATPRSLRGLPEIFQEQTSFSHQSSAGDSASKPIRGKRHGAFVCAEIKPAKWPKTEKGNSVKSRMTSPSLFLQNS